MSEAAETSGMWMRQDGPGPARERLRKAVSALTRARRLQLMVDSAFAGLLAGLCLATLAVLAVRRLQASFPTWPLAGALVLGAVAIALLLGWSRRPAPLDVAIRADVMLRLKQRLSTAWEFMTGQADAELTDRLAVQALRAGLPARPRTVFPLRVNRWGWLVPLAATALVLVSVADLGGMQVRSPAPAKVDEQVVGEGERLGAFGREMQARARRDQLPRSTRQAEQIERLGARMQSGALDRSEALGQLGRMTESTGQERMQALADAKGAERGVGRGQRAEGSGLDTGAMLERMQRGGIDAADRRALSRRLDDIERSGIPRQDLQRALERQQAGADEALREILEKLAQLDRALKEDKELRAALEQLRRARESLGDPRASAEGRQGASAAIDWGEDEREDGDARSAEQASADARLDSPSTGRLARAASQADASPATERADAPLRPESGPAGRVLRPDGQVRTGEDFSSQGRMLPRANRPGVASVDMPDDYAAQVEAVLAREHYPEHRKEFVRRYFLNLSQGARAAAQPPVAREEKRE